MQSNVPKTRVDPPALDRLPSTKNVLLFPASPSDIPTPSPFSKPTPTGPISLEPTQPVSVLLRAATAQVHKDAETSAGAKALLSGQLPKEDYGKYLGMLWHVYDALETALDENASHPCIAPIYNPALLRRSEALASDIHYCGTPSPTIPPQLASYIARIRTATPPQLVAHAYVRYLGDLSGGQIIKRILTKAYGSSDGLSFYDFGGDVGKLKTWFREGMDEGVVSEEDKMVAVEEAKVAFKFNEALLNLLQPPLVSSPIVKEEGPTGNGWKLAFPPLPISLFAIAVSYVLFRGYGWPLPIHFS